jgi:hypothetical protein
MRDPKTRDKFAAFLRANLRPFSLVLNESPLRAAFYAGMRRGAPPKGLTRPDVYDPTQFICVGRSQIAYGGTASGIGFNFSASWHYGQYMQAVCAWLALRGGKLVNTGTPSARKSASDIRGLADKGLPSRQVRYYTYDTDKWPVLQLADIAAIPEGDARESLKRQWLVDDYGCCPEELVIPRYCLSFNYEVSEETQAWAAQERERTLTLSRVVRAEMQRLHAAWLACP